MQRPAAHRHKAANSAKTIRPTRCSAGDDQSATSQDAAEVQSAPVPTSPPEPSASLGLPLALGAAALGAAVFVGLRGGSQAATFDVLQSESLPLEQALSNRRPTVIEFYASWCEVCRELLPDSVALERNFKGSVNYVALNVDNSKWAPEVTEFGVQGIPQYVFLDPDGKLQASAAGRVPQQVLQQNFQALAQGKPLPWARVREAASQLTEDKGALAAPRSQVQPRTHG